MDLPNQDELYKKFTKKSFDELKRILPNASRNERRIIFDIIYGLYDDEDELIHMLFGEIDKLNEYISGLEIQLNAVPGGELAIAAEKDFMSRLRK